MPPARKLSKARRPANRFYHSAKVSEYQFKRVLWAFVRDLSAGEAAKSINLSTNSIAAIYDKLRRFFTDLGVFKDVYAGGQPEEGIDGNDELAEYEYRLIGFHLQRAREKRRMKDTIIDESDPHWCESAWRFDYATMVEGRAPESIHRMMYAHLLAHIRLAGPVSRPSSNRNASGAQLRLVQLDQRVQWLGRNSIYKISINS